MTTIYSLKDPVSGDIRYVGKTSENVNRRYRDHLRGKSGIYCKQWIASLLYRGLRPILETIEICEDNWIEREQHWIAYYRTAGCKLANLTNGGEGCPGHIQSAETRLKKSTKLKGIIRSPQWCQRISAAKLGQKMSDSVREKVRQRCNGKKLPPSAYANSLATRLGKPLSYEHRIKISTSRKLLGLKLSEEQKMKLATINRKPKWTPEQRRTISERLLKNHPMKGKHHKIESRIKISLGGKRAWQRRRLECQQKYQLSLPLQG